MPQFYTLLTDTGQAKIANAVALGTQIEITQMAVGDGGGNPVTPDSSATALVNEVRRAPINAVQTDDDNPTWIVIEQVLPPDVGGWTIREVGVFDASGDLIAIGNLPETYKPVLAEGSSRTQTIRVVMEVSDTAAVTLKVDPSVVLATREYVDQQRLAHEQSRNHPLATESEKGMAIKATQVEVNSGEDDGKFITATKLKNWGVQWVKSATETVAGMLKVATQAQVDAGSDDATAVTPKKLRSGFSISLGTNGYVGFPTWLGGVIFQWGYVSFTGPDSTGSSSPASSSGHFHGVVTYNASWPVPFPNSVFCAFSSTQGDGAEGGELVSTLAGVGTHDLVGRVYRMGGSNTSGEPAGVVYFGIGK
ncbi:phage tail protein [Halomonas denitrificans]|uniref:phage tail protein n=1 Tax=Halomonas denitrificans TaxID=370769 RepID=UPI001C99375D|nr:phage tail protein [Halomonas denitrificans]MBY5969912.1 phage tail protein [Halomonas denitrificans]